MSIFVSIASYSDPLLAFTLARAVATASRPQELHLGVFDQGPAAPAGQAPRADPARLSYLRIDPVYARGPCWARYVAMSLYEGEDWFLQIDAHTEFEPGWDDRLVAQARLLLPGRRGAVVSAYPQAFYLRDGRAWRKPLRPHVLAHAVQDGSTFVPGDAVLAFQAIPVDSTEPLPAFHIASGCLFAPGEFVQRFPYDPWLYFHGEEQALSARLFTHGWDMFHMPALPLFHLYHDHAGDAAPRPLHWDDAQDAGRPIPWHRFDGRSRKRLECLLGGDDLGVFGLGTVRTLADYADFSGIDYAARTLAPRAYRRGEIEERPRSPD